MEKVIYILIISVIADYWLTKIFKIIFTVISECQRRISLEEKGYVLNKIGDIIKSPQYEMNRKTDVECFLFKKQ